MTTDSEAVDRAERLLKHFEVIGAANDDRVSVRSDDLRTLLRLAKRPEPEELREALIQAQQAIESIMPGAINAPSLEPATRQYFETTMANIDTALAQLRGGE